MFIDRRLFNTPSYSLDRPKDWWMLVPQVLLSAVVFLGQRGATEDVIGGTAFFVAVPYTLIPERRHIYVVTARHSLEDAPTDLFIRINNPAFRMNKPAAGTFAFGLPDAREWLTHPDPAAGEDYVDVAAIRLDTAAAGAVSLGNYRWVPESMFFSETLLGDDPNSGVGVGDEVVTIGLFSLHSGKQRNEPVVRTGNLAMVPAEPMLVQFSQPVVVSRRMRLYLTELRSISGLSGSPVFIRHRNFIGSGSAQVSLLGLMIGHWDDGDRNHRGFGMVVPARLIDEVINQEDEVKKREEAERKELVDGGGAVQDSAFEGSEWDRFERLAKQVANTPKPNAEDEEETD